MTFSDTERDTRHASPRLWVLILRFVVPVAILATAGYLAWSLVSNRPQAVEGQVRERSYVIRTVPAVIGTENTGIVVFGEIRSVRSVELRVPVSGKVVRVSPQLEVGNLVTEGTELIAIDRFTYEGELRDAEVALFDSKARLAEAEAQLSLERTGLANATKQLSLASKDLQRAQALRKSGAVTKKHVDDRDLVVLQRRASVQRGTDMIAVLKAKLDQARLAIKRAEWKLEQAQRNLSDTVLKAPFDGVVRSKNTELGRIADTNDMILSLYDPDKLEVRFILSDRQYGRLLAQGSPIGRKVSVIWRIGDAPITFDGEVERIGADVKSSEGGIELFATVIPSGAVSLRPGAFVEVSLPGPTYENVARLPESALYNGTHVFVVENDRIARRDVRALSYDDKDVLVRGDLKTADQVMITRIAEAGPGLKVTLEPQPAKGPNGLNKRDTGDKTPQQSARGIRNRKADQTVTP